MAIRPTRYSRVSVGFVSSTESVVDKDPGDTGPVFSVLGDTVVTGTTTETGNKHITGALTVTSTLSVGGAATHSGTVSVGAGTAIAKVISSLMSVGGAEIAAHESVTSTYLNNNAAVGDVVVFTPASQWSGAYGDLYFYGKVSTASVIDVTIGNSTTTNVTPAAMNWRATLIRF